MRALLTGTLLALIPASGLVAGCPREEPVEPVPIGASRAAPPREAPPGAGPQDGGGLAAAEKRAYPDAKGTVVRLMTDRGKVVLELYDRKMPRTVRHFTKLVRDGFYDGRTWYRVEDWVIQAGVIEPPPDARRLKFEAHPDCTHEAGAVGMARGTDPDSASTEFYIVKRDSHDLDDAVRRDRTGGRERGYACFGRVIEGMDVVETTVRDDTILAAEVVQEPE